MKDLANESGEACPCWLNEEPIIKFEGEDGLRIKVQCRDNVCGKTFERTEKELVDKFRIFYKV